MYNKNGLVESVTDANGNTYKYEYDLDGNCTKMILPDNQYMETKYDIRGRIIEEIDQTGSSTKYAYDNADHLISVTDSNDSTWTYDYDVQGNITCVTDPQGNKTSYTFDKMNRLVKTTLPMGMTATNTYDKYGYKTAYTDYNGDTTRYVYDEYYDLDKVIYADGTTTDYTYDKNRMLVQVDFNGQTIKYEYNELDGLKKKSLSDGTFVGYNYYDDGSLKSVTTNYTYGTDMISIDNSGTVSYYLTDGQGSTRALTDENGIITDTYTYDAFGNVTAQTGDTYNPYLYNQEQYDANTGLYYLRARYMNPSTGRFISMDAYSGSIYDPMSLHKYLYASASPTVYCDPTGYSDTTLAGQMTVCGILEVLCGMVVQNMPQFGTTVATILVAASANEAFDAWTLKMTLTDIDPTGGWIVDPAPQEEKIQVETFPVTENYVYTEKFPLSGPNVWIETFPLSEEKSYTETFPLDEGKKVSDYVMKNIVDNSLDDFPAENHHTVNEEKDLPIVSEPNSSIDLLNEDGTPKRRRFFDDEGRAERDIDYNHSNGDGTHKFPHEHQWRWEGNKPIRSK